jgi:hypothetical protein
LSIEPSQPRAFYRFQVGLKNILCSGLWTTFLLLGLVVAGCHRSGDNAGKGAATNKVAVATQSAGRTNKGPILRPAVNRPATNNLPSNIPHPGVQSNAVGAAARPGVKTNLVGVATGPGAGVRTNAVAAATSPAGKGSRLAAQFRHFQTSAAFYPVLVSIAICLGFGGIFLFQYIQSKSAKARKAAAEAVPKAASRPVVKKARRVPVHSCNVLDLAPEARHLWHFGARGRGFVLNRQQTSFTGEVLPAGLIAKDWRTLWRRKLNIAWLPPEHVFLRVTQLPASDFTETLSMIELQLEKLSPLPVAQIVWSIQVLPHPEGNLQTVIVMIVARSVVEEFLGKLEGQGYLADRLELPRLDQLLATEVSGDGAWIYPEVAGVTSTALVAWWYGGVLQSLGLITLPASDRPESLKEQLLQLAWAGELEGWLTAPPGWHLVAEASVVADWEPALRPAVDQPVQTIAALAPPELAARTATRAVQSEPQANLLPVEFSTRYQAQFVDRLWMRGIGALIGLYLVGVLVYFARLQFELYRTSRVEQQVAQVGPIYTNAIQLKAKCQVLKDRQDWKWAALDCWKAIAELLPDGVTLDGFNLTEGKRLALNGSAPAGQEKRLLDFDKDIRKAPGKDNLPLFDPNEGEHVTWHAGPNGTVVWNCILELRRSEVL